MQKFLNCLPLALLLPVFLLVSGCAGKKAGATPFKITFLLDWTPNTNHSGLYAAQELGYFTAAGLNVEIRQAPEGSGMDLLAAGKAQFTISDQSDVTAAVDSGLPVIGVAAVLQNNNSAFASLASKNIIRPRDFENRRYMGWGGAVEEAIIRTLVSADGGDPDKVIMVPMNGLADLTALTTNQADIIWYYKGWDGIAARLAGVAVNEITLINSAHLNFYSPVIVASTAFIDASPAEAKAFMQALAKGYIYAAENPAQAADILLKYAPGLNKELVEASQRYLAQLYLTSGGRFGITDRSRIDSYTAWLYDNGIISAPIESEKLFTNRLL
jgi:ABC-type nitrate/sulfonate/bicarbonate transport system substrate-binding protein